MKKTILAIAGGAALLGAGCDSRGPAHDAANDHHHDEPESIPITVWTDRYEVFAEHQPPAAGQSMRLVTHVTDRPAGEPRREGPLRFVLKQGSTVVERSVASPVRPGIYIPDLVFPAAGDWQVTVEIRTDGAEEKVDLGVVKVYADAHAAMHAEMAEPAEGITFLKEQQWKVRTTTERVGRRRIVERLRVSATVTARPGSAAQVTAPLAGRVLPPPGGVMPMLGDRVEKGRPLVLLRPAYSEVAVRLAEVEAEIGRAVLALEQAEVNHRRVQKLAAVDARSVREVEEAVFALKSAEARLGAARALRATLRPTESGPAGSAPAGMLEIPLLTPIGGVIADQRRTADGEHVPADTMLFSILDSGRVLIEGRVPEAAAGRLAGAAGRGAGYELPGDPQSFTEIAGEVGRLVYVGQQVDAVTRTVALVYDVNNPEGRLRIGQLLTLQVETDRSEDALAIPLSALVEEGGLFVAFVQVGGETFAKRELRLGLRDSGHVQVLDGLRDGDRVVTRGAYAVRLASAMAVIPAHGHSH